MNNNYNDLIFNAEQIFELIDANGISILYEIPKDTVRPLADGSGIVQIVNGRIVATLKNEDIAVLCGRNK